MRANDIQVLRLILRRVEDFNQHSEKQISVPSSGNSSRGSIFYNKKVLVQDASCIFLTDLCGGWAAAETESDLLARLFREFHKHAARLEGQ